MPTIAYYIFHSRNTFFCCVSCLLYLIAPSSSVFANDDDILEFLPAIIASASSPLPRVDFSVALPDLPNSRRYTIELNRWDIPSNRSNAVKTTDNLQAAINWAASQGFAEIELPAGTYLIGKYGNPAYQKGIEIPNNVGLLLHENAVIEMASNDKWNYCAVRFNYSENSKISGGTIIGDRDSHVYTPRNGSTIHDEGHLICVEKSRRILIENLTLRNANGDGILMAINNFDVTVRNSDFYNNRRQGISLVGAVRVMIENNHIHHTKGTAPQFGVDIEGKGERLNKNIIIQNNRFNNNRGGDVVNTDGTRVYIRNNTMRQGAGNTYIDGPIVIWRKTDQVIANNEITMTERSVNGWHGIMGYSFGSPKANDNISYVYKNTCNNCGFYNYDSANFDIRRNKFFGSFLGLVNIKNATVIDNVVTGERFPYSDTRGCRLSYRFSNVTGRAKGNVYIFQGQKQAINLPLSSSPWTPACMRD